MKNIQNKKVLILGLGVSGLAMARWCSRYGAEVTIADTRTEPPQYNILKKNLSNIKFICSQFESNLILNGSYDLLLISPGIKPKDVENISSIAIANNIIIANELILFTNALAGLKESQSYSPCILAITGTNGKTTVTSLTGKLVESTGRKVVVAGNIGPSLLDTLIEKSDLNELPEVWVLELSSFQLHAAEAFEPTVGVVLNLSQDHLDWHGSMDEYARAKSLIFGKKATMMLNRDDSSVMEMLLQLDYSKNSRKIITFGADIPKRAGDFGLELIDGMAWLVKAIDAEETVSKRRNLSANIKEEIYIQRLLPAGALKIHGRHNMLNALVALSLSELANCKMASILYALREYRGEPHRVESIGFIRGVEYFDDSKGTNVGATVAALNGLGAGRKVVVILGGESKEQDFLPLLKPVNQYARSIILIGKDKLMILASLRDSIIPIQMADTMLEAVSIAFEQACDGDAVLLSPACASFDM
ncbi:MAG: UDP-N-acetylmuramoyl-L-alanine--D-glutamate ligase, partial [Burkholderiaceae bacterium]